MKQFQAIAGIVSWVLVLGGLLYLVITMMRVSMIHVRYLEVRTMLVRLLRSDPSRAEIMMKRVPGSLLDAFSAAFKMAGQTQTRDPNILVSATRPTYDAACQMIVMGWKKFVGHAKRAMIIVIIGFGFAFNKGKWPWLMFFIALAAVIGFVWVWGRKAETERSMTLGRAEVLPEIERVFAEGRYGVG